MSNKIIEIGNAKARAGEIVEGSIEVTKHAGGNDLLIPFTIINGINDGPCFWINGGIHGDEPEGVLTCSILRKKIDPKNLSGSLVLMPVMTVSSSANNIFLIAVFLSSACVTIFAIKES